MKVSGPSNIFSIIALLIKEPSSETPLRLAELVFTLNCFSFGVNYYKQTNGEAMGTKMGPSYDNLFVGFIEHQFFIQYHGPNPELYGRYIDDCIGATSSSREGLTQFITAVNSFHPALKYTWEISDTFLAFLDIKISIEGNGLCTSVNYKPTDSHSYLLYSFSHPPLRIPYLFHSFSDFVVYVMTNLIFQKNQKQFTSFSIKVATLSVVQANHHLAQQIDRQSALQTAEKENTDRIPFTLTFHPHNHAVNSINLKNFKLL